MRPATIVAAPNAFKGSLTPDQAARAMARGIQKVSRDILVKQVPVSDGGDGLIPAVKAATQARTISVSVNDPRMRPRQADFLLIKDRSTAVIEMALASGLALLPRGLQDPTLTTTLGTGELIRAALDKGASRILLGIGGSATCDGGIGAAAALGYRFLDKNGKALPPVGNALTQIHSINPDGADPRIGSTRFSVACDVTNPFFGPNGAAVVYGPQKGGTPDQVSLLDQGLKNLDQVIQKDLGHKIARIEGAGAAGGLGGGMKAFFNANLDPGIDLVLDLIDFKTKIKGADLVLTGEGCIDGQTIFNKAPAGVARVAKKNHLPCMALCGSIGPGAQKMYDLGIDALFSLCSGPIHLDIAMAEADELLSQCTENAVRAFLSGRKIHDR